MESARGAIAPEVMRDSWTYAAGFRPRPRTPPEPPPPLDPSRAYSPGLIRYPAPRRVWIIGVRPASIFLRR